MKTRNTVSLLSAALFLFLLSCQDDAEFQNKKTTTSVNSSEDKSYAVRVGNHDYWYFFRNWL